MLLSPTNASSFSSLSIAHVSVSHGIVLFYIKATKFPRHVKQISSYYYNSTNFVYVHFVSSQSRDTC